MQITIKLTSRVPLELQHCWNSAASNLSLTLSCNACICATFHSSIILWCFLYRKTSEEEMAMYRHIVSNFQSEPTRDPFWKWLAISKYLFFLGVYYQASSVVKVEGQIIPFRTGTRSYQRKQPSVSSELTDSSWGKFCGQSVWKASGITNGRIISSLWTTHRKALLFQDATVGTFAIHITNPNSPSTMYL